MRQISEISEWRMRQRSHGLTHVSVASRWRRTALSLQKEKLILI